MLAGRRDRDENPYQERPPGRPGERRATNRRPVHRRRQDRRRSAARPPAFTPTAPSTPAAWSSAPAWSTCPRGCASRASNTRPRWNPRCRPRPRAASPVAGLPARHRPAAGRAGAGRDAQAPRQEPAEAARLSAGRAHPELEGKTLTEMAELTEAGCIAFSQADAPIATPRCCCAPCSTPPPSASAGLAAPAGCAPGARRRRARRRGGHAPGPARHSGAGRDRGAGDHPAAGARDRRARAPVPPVHARRRGHGARGQGTRAWPSPAMSPCTTCTCRTSTSASSIATATCAAAAQPARPRRDPRRRCTTAPSTRSAPTTPRWTTTTSSCPFAEAEPGATGAGTAAAADAEVGARNGDAAAAGARADFVGRRDPGRCRRQPGAGQPCRRLPVRPQRPWIVTREALASQGRNSPFLNHPMQGRVRYTLIDGHIDFESPQSASHRHPWQLAAMVPASFPVCC